MLARSLATLLTVLLLASALSVFHFTISPARHGALGFLSYAYSELLINYSAGFIRRGLLGMLIARAAHGGGAVLVVGKLLFLNYCVLATGLTLLAFRKLRSAWRVLLVVAVPTGVIAMALTAEYWYRKETFSLALLTVTGVLKIGVSRTKPQPLRRQLALVLTGLILAESVFFSLLHDGFTFMVAPAYAYLLQGTWSLRGEGSLRPARLFSRCYLAAQVVSFFVLGLVFHTNARIADRIWASLSPLDRAFYSGADRGGIDTLTLGLPAVVSTVPQLLNDGMLWWFLGPLFCLFAYTAAMVVLSGQTEESRRGWLRCYATIAFFAVPIYLMAYDYGRWTAALQLSFLVVWLASEDGELRDLDLLPAGLFRAVKRLLGQSVGPLRQLVGIAERFLLRHINAGVVAMLCFDAFSYIPEVSLNGHWTSISRQLIFLGRLAFHAIRHRS